MGEPSHEPIFPNFLMLFGGVTVISQFCLVLSIHSDMGILERKNKYVLMLLSIFHKCKVRFCLAKIYRKLLFLLKLMLNNVL